MTRPQKILIAFIVVLTLLLVWQLTARAEVRRIPFRRGGAATVNPPPATAFVLPVGQISGSLNPLGEPPRSPVRYVTVASGEFTKQRPSVIVTWIAPNGTRRPVGSTWVAFERANHITTIILTIDDVHPRDGRYEAEVVTE